GGTRYYIDPTSGRLLLKVDAAQRGYRWLFEGLHRFDFTAALRSRPLWDVLMILLLAGVTGVSATGTFMGIRYLRRQARRSSQWTRRQQIATRSSESSTTG